AAFRRYDYASKIAPPGDAPPAADRPRIPAATFRFPRRAAVALQQQGLAVTTSASGSRRSRRAALSHSIPSMFAVVATVFAVVLALPIAAFAAGTAMFSTLAGSTGEKPQSKIWYHAGSYWAVLRGPDGLAIYEKQGSSWVRGRVTNAVLASNGKADVKWNGKDLFVLNYQSTTRVFKYTYNATARTWSLGAGFPVTVPNPSGSETMVLEQDSSGRLWIVAEGGNHINVYYL